VEGFERRDRERDLTREKPLPGFEPWEALVLIVTFFACGFGIPALLGERTGMLFALIVGISGAFIGVPALAIYFVHRKKVAEGVVAKQPGDAGQVILLAQKFRERAGEIEEALRWGKKEVGVVGWQLKQLFEDVHRIANREQSTVLRGFDLWIPNDDWAHQAGANEEFRSAMEIRAHQFRSKADQLDELAQRVTGVEKTTPQVKPTPGCAIVALVVCAGGGYLIYRGDAWGGGAVVVIGVAMLILVLRGMG